MTKLEARVLGENRVRAYAKRIDPILREFFAQYIGQKIQKQDGGLLEKIKSKLPVLPQEAKVTTWMRSGGYSISWEVKTSETVDGVAYYATAAVYVCQVRDGILEKLYAPYEGRSDFTAREIEEKRRILKLAEQAYNDAKSALFPFEEYDR